MKFKLFITFFGFLSTCFLAHAQISYGGKPKSFSLHRLKSLSIVELPVFNNQELLNEESADRSKPFCYGKTHEVRLTPENSGSWQTLEDGSKIWLLRLKSENAYSLSIICDHFKLNNGTKLFIYSPDKNQLKGAFTDKNNLANGYFSAAPVAGNEMIVELNIEKDKSYGLFTISGIVHDYKNILKTGLKFSGSCNVNINCPEGADWQIEKKSVLKYTYWSGGKNYLCSGALINNTAEDGKPYFLTAEHCISSTIEAASALFYFNYEGELCESTSGPIDQTLSSASLIATGGDLDFSLLELSSIPPLDYNAIYAGWDHGTTPASNTVCIHHPSGDIKKISIDNEAPSINDYGEGYVTNSHWNIAKWDKGTTEGGSSGSPLFNQNHRIIGDLTGGDASCSYNYNDFFSRFDLSWDYHSETTKQLKTWLDPLNLGVETIDGFDLKTLSEGLDARINRIVDPNYTICGVDSIIPKIVVYNNGSVNLTSLDIAYTVNDGEIVQKHWTGFLSPLQSMIYVFNKTKLPLEYSTITYFVSSPNGFYDIKTTNDTITRTFYAQNIIENPQILGDDMTCPETESSIFSVDAIGAYKWIATGGIISGSDKLQEILVNWEKEWGERKIEVNVSNLCNSANADAVNVVVIEQGIDIEIVTGDNASEITWNIKDCNGAILYTESNLPSNSSYTKNLNIEPGCYQFNISTGTASVQSYSVSNLCKQTSLISGQNLSGTYHQNFEMEQSDYVSAFNLYPNPSVDKMTIEARFVDLYVDAFFSIINRAGVVIVPKQSLKERTIFDISSFTQGVYFFQIETPRGKFIMKFVKI